MSDQSPAGPPWTLDVLADLQAGCFTPEIESDLRARIGNDPQALAILGALDSTVDALSLLPSLVMPDRYVMRLDAAIAAESATRTAALSPRVIRQDLDLLRNAPVSRSSASSSSAPVSGIRQFVSPPPTQRPASPVPPFQPQIPQQSASPPQSGPQPLGVPRQYAPTPDVVRSPEPSRPAPPEATVTSLEEARSRRRRWIGGLAMAAAVAAVATITFTSLNQNHPAGSSALPEQSATTVVVTTGTPAGAPAQPGSAAPQAIELEPGKFQNAYAQINGAKAGSLADFLKYTGCLAANKISGDAVLGVTDVTYQGTRASAIAVAVSSTKARIVVVGMGCGVDGADFLAEQTVDR